MMSAGRIYNIQDYINGQAIQIKESCTHEAKQQSVTLIIENDYKFQMKLGQMNEQLNQKIH